MATADRKFHLVIFGASGFTGQFVVEEVARTIGQEDKDLKWAIAGRDMKKLQAVLDEAAKHTGQNLDDIEILITNVNNEESLNEMCQQTQLVLNCVGPYRFYGHAVVKACIENGTHHIDLCGEPGFLENAQLLYNEKAREKGSYVVGSCGFDSIPSEMGVVYTKQQFKGDVNDIEGYLSLHTGPEGSHGNFGTWQSAIYGIAFAQELREVRKRLFPERLPKSNYPPVKRPLIWRSKEVGGWCMPFVGCDRSVVYRTQQYNYTHRNVRPVQYNLYFRVPNILALGYLMIMGIIFGVCAKFSLGRYLLEKFPKLMSLGLFASTGPSRKQIEGCSFRMTFFARGYDEKLEDPKEQHKEPPNVKVVTTVTGPEIGYATTPICMVQAAYVLLKEKDKLPAEGGVFTPGGVFADTTLIERLDKHNVKFGIKDQK